jgi:hypothetical protein
MNMHKNMDSELDSDVKFQSMLAKWRICSSLLLIDSAIIISALVVAPEEPCAVGCPILEEVVVSPVAEEQDDGATEPAAVAPIFPDGLVREQDVGGRSRRRDRERERDWGFTTALQTLPPEKKHSLRLSVCRC